MKEKDQISDKRYVSWRGYKNAIQAVEEASVIPIAAKPRDGSEFPPRLPGQSIETYNNALMAVGIHYGTDRIPSQNDIGKTRDNFRWILVSGLKILNQNSNNDLLAISTFKPRGIVKQIAIRLDDGEDFDDVVHKLKVNVDHISKIRKRLEEWEFILAPKQEKTYTKPYIERLADPDLSDKILQRLLKRVTKKDYETNSSGEDSLFISVSEAARDAGMHFSANQLGWIVSILLTRGMPFGSFKHPTPTVRNEKKSFSRYFFIRRMDLERANKVWRNHPASKKFMLNPVTRIGNPSEKIPNTTELKRNGKPVMNLIVEIKGKRLKNFGDNSTSIEDLIEEDCPVPIFRTDVKYYYLPSDENLLRDYLSQTMRKRGIIKRR